MTRLERRYCVVDDCGWVLERDLDTVHDDAFEASMAQWGPGDTIESVASRAALADAATVEDELRGHLESHDVVDFARTIVRLRQAGRELAAAYSPTPDVSAEPFTGPEGP